jgi:Flp pilus assembly protein TadG
MVNRKLKIGEDGQAMVETALAFPVLLMVMTMVMQFALIYNASNLTRYAAFCVARCASVYATKQGDLVTKCKEAASCALAPVTPPATLIGGVMTSELGSFIQRYAFCKTIIYTFLPSSNGIVLSTTSPSFRTDINAKVGYAFGMQIPVANKIMNKLSGFMYITQPQLMAALMGIGIASSTIANDGGTYFFWYMDGMATMMYEGKDPSFEENVSL